MSIPVIVCEGAAEQAIIDLLLDHHFLKVERDELLFQRTLTPISGTYFQQQVLAHDFSTDSGNDYFDDEIEDQSSVDIQLAVHVVQDSTKRALKLVSPDVRELVANITYYVTKSEIEAIQLRSDPSYLKQYEQFKKHRDGKIKPSQFFKKTVASGGLGITDIKIYQVVYDLWSSRVDQLVAAVNSVAHEMHRKKSLRGSQPNYLYLADLLKSEYRK